MIGPHFLLPLIAISIPLLVFAWYLFIGIQEKHAGTVAISSLLVAFIVWLVAISSDHSLSIEFGTMSVSQTVSVRFGILLDAPACLISTLVFGIGFLVAWFSRGYLREDGRQGKFYMHLCLFIFSMLMLVQSMNLLQMFVFWELVGFASFLLIAFDVDRKKSVWASRKAILVNKLADMGFLAGIGLVYTLLGTLDFEVLQWVNIQHGNSTFMAITGFCFLLAAMGKSAQVPLSFWLPQAMAAPTPVSALLHAATMVVAGVFLLIRMFPLLAPVVLHSLIWVGLATALTAALSAAAQYDIKRVLAFSTVSQLGLMMACIGFGAPDAALFHLTAHAMFKAGLFLVAGAVFVMVHEADRTGIDVQDMRQLGGLKKKMPGLFWLQVVFALSLSGIPFFSGFLSKEAVLLHGLQRGSICAIFLILISGLTAFYTARLTWLTWLGPSRLPPQSFASLGPTKGGLLTPLIPLAVCSFWFVFGLHPFDPWGTWPMDILDPKMKPQIQGIGVIVLSQAIILMGFIMAYITRLKTGDQLPLLANHFYFDWIYHKGLAYVPKLLAAWASKADQGYTLSLDRIGRFQVVLAHIFSWFDTAVIDGLITAGGKGIQLAGNALRVSLSGKLQAYMSYIFLLIFLLALYLILS